MIVPIVSVTCESKITYFPSSHTALNLLCFVFCLLKGLFDWYLQDKRLFLTVLFYGLPLGLSGRESACQCRRCKLHPWMGISVEKEMATHSSILAWEIPWTEDPGRLQAMGSQGVRHDLAAKQQYFFITVSTYYAYICKNHSCNMVT